MRFVTAWVSTVAYGADAALDVRALGRDHRNARGGHRTRIAREIHAEDLPDGHFTYPSCFALVARL